MATAAAVTERPLHVRVAAAFGWTALRTEGRWKFWIGTPPNMPPSHTAVVPLFDADWRLAGPLIEKYGISLHGPVPGDAEWDAYVGFDDEHRRASAPTPLAAVCLLLLKLAEAGKL